MKMILMLTTAAALATAAGAEPLVVGDGDTQPTVRVAFDDLNLASQRGRERLTNRVTAAVRAMCRDDNLDSLKVELAENHCFAASMHQAGMQIEQAVKTRSPEFASRSLPIGIVRR